MGSTSGVLIFYVYPAAFFLHLRHVLHKRKAESSVTRLCSQYKVSDFVMEGVAWCMLGSGAVLFVLQNYVAVNAIVERSPLTNYTAPYCFIECSGNFEEI